MPLIDITNPAVIIFLIENYEKENRLRLNWIHKNFAQVEQAATLQREPTNYYETDVTIRNMVGGMAAITRDHVVAGRNRKKVPIRDGTFVPGIKHLRHGHSVVDIGLAKPTDDPRLQRPEHDLSNDPIMRPVNPEISKIIFKPKPEYGREEYLRKREKISPENKYYFTQGSNWEYGWRMRDSYLREKAKYGRCWHLTNTLKNRVGPQPDPYYYKNSDIPGVSKCITL